MDDALKTKSIKNIQMLKLGCCFPQPEQNIWLRAWLHCWYLPKDLVVCF